MSLFFRILPHKKEGACVSTLVLKNERLLDQTVLIPAANARGVNMFVKAGGNNVYAGAEFCFRDF